MHEIQTLDSLPRDLVSNGDLEFLKEHVQEFRRRYETRPFFAPKHVLKTEVLNDSEHPTSDNKYWVAIGNQSVHVTELIKLNYEVQKIKADIDLFFAEIDELEEQIIHAKQNRKPEWHVKKLEARLARKKVELEQKQFSLTECKKVAKERIRTIRSWEELIEPLKGQLKYGDIDPDLHREEKDLIQKEQLEPTKKSMAIDMPSREELKEKDKIAKKYLDRKVRKIMIATPHRSQDDGNATDFSLVYMPAGCDVFLEQPYGFTVADARNFVVQKAIEEDMYCVFFVDDDVIIPSNALIQLYKDMHDLKADLTSGVYYRKRYPLETAPMVEQEDGTPGSLPDSEKGIILNPVVAISGCTLIKIDTLKQIEQPWYKSYTVEGRAAITEDTYLCERLREIGAITAIDTKVQCIHVDKEKGIYYADPDYVKDNRIIKKDYFAIKPQTAMFEYLRGYDKIIVSGPQRSGTTIAAKMIAHDLGRKWFDEGPEPDVDRYVWSCPMQTRWLHEFGQKDDTAIVFMRRDIADIIRSQERVNWTESQEPIEYANYEQLGYDNKTPIAKIKYHFWDSYQKKKCKHPYEIEYESLKKHPLWVPKDQRKNFWTKQIDSNFKRGVERL